MTKHVLVTGGQGYKGSVLIPILLAQGYRVTSFDIGWFGNYLPAHHNLQVIEGDIRDINNIPFKGVDVVIHLASIANDPCSELNPKLTWEVSGLASMMLADKARRNGVSQFIYASSGSVYGVSNAPTVTEDIVLDPISEYNKTKMVAERVMLSYSSDMDVQIIRPATVCGYSPRMRFDVAVNLLTLAATKGEITVLGGDQVRPNIHIMDICKLYLFFLKNPKITGIFNAGFENLSIAEIASMAANKTGAKIKVLPSNDPRSYRVDSSKLLKVGFVPEYNVAMAIDDLIQRLRSGMAEDLPNFHNLKWMKEKCLADV